MKKQNSDYKLENIGGNVHISEKDKNNNKSTLNKSTKWSIGITSSLALSGLAGLTTWNTMLYKDVNILKTAVGLPLKWINQSIDRLIENLKQPKYPITYAIIELNAIKSMLNEISGKYDAQEQHKKIQEIEQKINQKSSKEENE